MKLWSWIKQLARFTSESDQSEEVQTLSSNISYKILVGPQRFWVVFRDADHDYPFKSFLKKGFSHVTLVQQHEFGWVMLNPTRAHLHVDILDFATHENPMDLLKRELPDTTILEVIVSIDSEVDNFFMPINCVVMANYLLGLRWPPFSCITPFSLYRNLLTRTHPNILKVTELKHEQQIVAGDAQSPTSYRDGHTATFSRENSYN